MGNPVTDNNGQFIFKINFFLPVKNLTLYFVPMIKMNIISVLSVVNVVVVTSCRKV